MAHHRLVMIGGSGPGAGKSTLAQHLHRELHARDLAAELWPEMALFEWESLADLADRFRRRAYPGPDDLIEVFLQVLGLADSNKTWIQDWTWIDIAEDLPWAVEDSSALDAFSKRAHAATAHLEPMVLYLRADIPTALARAVRQRGQKWLALRGSFEAVAAAYASRETRIRHAIDAGGWSTAELQVDSHAEQVLADALTVLQVPPAD